QESASSPLRDCIFVRVALDGWFVWYRGRLLSVAVVEALRQVEMQRVNAAVVLRMWLAVREIDAAVQGDMADLHRLHEV
ncbi:hypothetical protein ACSMCZ_23200, partial [Salmonella enterica]